MSEQQRIDELISKGTNHQAKFVYGMISLALGTLALSFQFSIKLQGFPYCLMSSWIVLFISILLGGWIIYILPTVFFANANILQHEMEISQFRQGPIHTTDLRKWTNEEVAAAIDKRKIRVKKNTTQIEEISKKAILAFRIQILFLVVGLFLLGLFTALNYLNVQIH